jgi:hypothetical protein
MPDPSLPAPPKVPSTPVSFKSKWFDFNLPSAVVIGFMTICGTAVTTHCSSNTTALEQKVDKLSSQFGVMAEQTNRDLTAIKDTQRKDNEALSNDVQLLKVQNENTKLRLETMKTGENK